MEELKELCGVLFFMHIPKTAGTSLRVQLSRWCRPGAMTVAYGNELCPVHPDPVFLKTVKQQAREIKVLFGHYGWGAHELLGQQPASYATMVRDSFDRAVSFYRHVAREPRSRHFRPIREGMGLKELVLSHRAPELNNHYVRMLLGGNRFALSLWPPDPTGKAGPIEQVFEKHHLEEAWQRMSGSFRHVGRTERYADSLAALAKMFGVSDPGEEEHLNVGPEDSFHGVLDSHTQAAVREHNALDIELYNRVVQRWG